MVTGVDLIGDYKIKQNQKELKRKTWHDGQVRRESGKNGKDEKKNEKTER